MVKSSAPLVLSLVGIAIFSLVIGAIRSTVVIPNLAIIYLLPILFSAVTWGWWPAVGAVVLAFLTYDFFFVEPVHTFTIRDPEEWLALLIFLSVAAVTSNLAARERARREEARRRAGEAELLYHLGRSLSGGATAEALGELATSLTRALGLTGCAVVLDEPQGKTRTLISVGEAADTAGTVLGRPGGTRRQLGRWIAVKGRDRERRPPVLAVPLHVGQRSIGALRLVGRRALADEETRVAATIADQLATALECEQLRAEAEQAEILRRTDELRQALLSSVSHDLRTPLASIKASAGSLLAQGVEWSEADRLDFLSTIDRESDRLNRLVGNLLDMSRIEGGALKPQTDWYDLGDLVREVVERLDRTLRGHPIRVAIPDDLPPIEIDYLMVDQVLTNLVENAAKYSPAGTPIEVRLEPEAASLRVAVVDHGPGVPVAERARIFDKFYRLGSRGAVGGSGLGLAVAKGLVEAHGGRVWVEDTPGGGATFCFTLPAGIPPAADRRQRSAHPRRRARFSESWTTSRQLDRLTARASPRGLTREFL
jgi:two-component system sensor histidine kinase KdpD